MRLNRSVGTTFKTTTDQTRPDTTIHYKHWLLLVGENKQDLLHAAEADLASKAFSRDPEHYQPLQYTLAYAAAGTSVQFFAVDMNGKVRYRCTVFAVDMTVTVRERLCCAR